MRGGGKSSFTGWMGRKWADPYIRELKSTRLATWGTHCHSSTTGRVENMGVGIVMFWLIELGLELLFIPREAYFQYSNYAFTSIDCYMYCNGQTTLARIKPGP